MKRWLTILILGLGTSILVIHAGIPHHHHEGVVCYHHDKATGHAEEASHHPGPSHPMDFNCSLKQLFITPSGKRMMIPKSFNISWNQPTQYCITVLQNPYSPPDTFLIKFLSHSKMQKIPDPVILLSDPRAPPLI